MKVHSFGVLSKLYTSRLCSHMYI